MATVVVKLEGVDKVSRAKVRIDEDQPGEKKVRLNEEGVASVPDVAPGAHILSWFLQGEDGAPYSMTITAPDEASFATQGCSLKEGEDEGLHQFEVQ